MEKIKKTKLFNWSLVWFREGRKGRELKGIRVFFYYRLKKSRRLIIKAKKQKILPIRNRSSSA